MPNKKLNTILFKDKKLIINFLSLVFLLNMTTAHAQCFGKYSKEGDDAKAKGELKLAIEKWEKAKKCSDKPANHNLDAKIREANSKLTKPKPSKPNKPNKPQETSIPSTPVIDQTQNDKIAWSIAESTNVVSAYELYLKKFPQGDSAIIARKRITELSVVPPKQNIPSPSPPTAVQTVIEPIMEMGLVKGGTFQMGNNNSRYDDEKPAHEVRLNDFYIGKYEVTIKQWKTIMGSLPDGNDDKSCPDCPVVNVSWNDTQLFIDRLNTKTGKKYRLPTEAEWEYAARGGSQSKKLDYAGSNNASLVGWFSENSNGKPNTVGKKIPNELGIYDMTGNVREWCADYYDENYYKNIISDNPKGATSGISRVFRGGDYNDIKEDLSLTLRGSQTDNFLDKNLGFRLVLEGK